MARRGSEVRWDVLEDFRSSGCGVNQGVSEQASRWPVIGLMGSDCHRFKNPRGLRVGYTGVGVWVGFI